MMSMVSQLPMLHTSGPRGRRIIVSSAICSDVPMPKIRLDLLLCIWPSPLLHCMPNSRNFSGMLRLREEIGELFRCLRKTLPSATPLNTESSEEKCHKVCALFFRESRVGFEFCTIQLFDQNISYQHHCYTIL